MFLNCDDEILTEESSSIYLLSDLQEKSHCSSVLMTPWRLVSYLHTHALCERQLACALHAMWLKFFVSDDKYATYVSADKLK
jgi:hypothetical protein